MQVASEHAEGEGVRSRIRMEEGLLLNRIALQRPDVPVGNHQRAAPVVADLANAAQPVLDQTAMGAGNAPHLVIRQLLVQGAQRAFHDPAVEL